MKKLSVVLLVITILAQFTVCTYAYTYNGNDLYSIDIPDEFYQTGDASFSHNDGSSLSISVNPNDEEYCVENMSKSEIQKNAEMEIEASKEAFEMFGKKGEMRLVSAQKVKHPNGKTASVTEFETTIEIDGEMVLSFQKSYTFAGKENIYSFVYITSDKEKIDDFQATFDSIDIAESEIKSNIDKAKEAVIALAFFALILIGIIRFLRTPEKRKKGKL